MRKRGSDGHPALFGIQCRGSTFSSSGRLHSNTVWETGKCFLALSGVKGYISVAISGELIYRREAAYILAYRGIVDIVIAYVHLV